MSDIESPPAHPTGPRAKPAARSRARDLRRAGRTYDQIARELGVSKSSVSLWVRDLPRPERRPRTRAESAAIGRRGWEARLRQRDEQRRRTKRAAAAQIGQLSERELFLIGVGLYWAEGSKSKPYRRSERVVFTNSDPDMIGLYLAWLDLLGVDRAALRFAVNIHESADVGGAERFWAAQVCVPVAQLQKTSLKRHRPSTTRKNVSAGHRGCLSVRLLQGADLYRRIEGWWCGIVGGAARTDNRMSALGSSQSLVV